MFIEFKMVNSYPAEYEHNLSQSRCRMYPGTWWCLFLKLRSQELMQYSSWNRFEKRGVNKFVFSSFQEISWWSQCIRFECVSYIYFVLIYTCTGYNVVYMYRYFRYITCISTFWSIHILWNHKNSWWLNFRRIHGYPLSSG